MDFSVEGMSCQHCVRAVTEAVSALPGVSGVVVDLPTGLVSVTGDPDPVSVREAIATEGYTVR